MNTEHRNTFDIPQPILFPKALLTMLTQQDAAMEQAKEFLRQVIKYRFWISISVAALFATIAYFVGSGPVREAAAKEAVVIKAAEGEVKKYNSRSHTQRPIQADCRGEDSRSDHGRQRRVEDALRPPGSSIDVAGRPSRNASGSGAGNGPRRKTRAGSCSRSSTTWRPIPNT